MAQARRNPPEPPQQPPEVDPDTAIQLLQERVTKANELLASRPLSRDAYSQWELLARNYLKKSFGSGSPNVTAVTDVGLYGAFPMNASEAWWENHRAESLATQVTRLEGLIELLQTEKQLRGGNAVKPPTPDPRGHRIFLVHGHDEAALQQAARFLERLRQDVVILHEQPNGGRTIMEKFEEYADVGFAVVLLTADDKGGSVRESAEEHKLRARQNVILELGYFLGRLGRARVCALYVDGVEIPSDYSGVLYVRLDSGGGWRLQLAKELKAAGLAVDMNDAL
jgi:predicted nucleotide-binding protein